MSVFIGPATKQMSEEIQEFTSFEKKLLQLQPKILNSVPGSAGKIYFDLLEAREKLKKDDVVMYSI